MLVVYALLTLAILRPRCVRAQKLYSPSSILFYQLNTAQGLSDNYILDMCMDKNGNLWIATGEGLNMFNGKTVTKFFKDEYPALTTDYLLQVTCDEANRIWIMTQTGALNVVDEQRKFHRISLMNDGKMMRANRILKTKTHGIVLFMRDKFFKLTTRKNLAETDSLTNTDFSEIKIGNFDSTYFRHFTSAEPVGDDNYIVSTVKGFKSIDFKNSRASSVFTFDDPVVLTEWRKDELLLYDKVKTSVFSINLLTGGISNPLDSMKDQHGKIITGRFNRALLLNKDQLWLTTANNGLYLFNTTTKKLFHFLHNAGDPTSMANNSPNMIIGDQSGWIFIGNTPNGVSYFKSNAVVGQQMIFADNQGNNYDGYINTIATRDNNSYYIGISDNLMLWKRNTNTTQFLAKPGSDKEEFIKRGVNYVALDNRKRVWVAMPSIGIYILDENNTIVSRLKYDSLSSNSLPSNYIRHMQMDKEGKYMWLSTRKGVCRVELQSLKVDTLPFLPFSDLKRTACNRTWFADSDNIWIATDGKGAWHYTFSTQRLEKYNKKTGLLNDAILCFNKDQFNNIYIGMPFGLQILFTNGTSKKFTVENGLLNHRVEALLLDKNNRMWIGNDVGLCCFNIKDTSIRVFDERYGLSIQGFRVNSYHQNSDDELVWGTERGLQYYYPDSLWKQTISLTTTINRVETRSVVSNLTQNAAFSLSATDNYITFYFSAIDYSKHLRTFYEYKLEGIDENWSKVTDQNFVRYNSLPAGRYTFRVKASNDGVTWEEAENEVTIRIAKRLWVQTWFRIVGAIIGLCLIALVVRYYSRKQKRKREELETEVVINYFASQINIHHNTEDMLWDVAKNCISKLNFEDCVIYLVNADRNVLIQKAAYGPKNPVDFTIHEPIEIPVGKGIVGAVALTGKPELVENTQQDDRYIVDDQQRFSEIAVPIIINNAVAGVIDSENAQKDFFTGKHLQILNTVAVLCANQIQRIRAEEEKKKASIELLENRQKATESRLQSLRLQMNPHFLFNALNSIQQMILANEDIIATKYLSRFSKLLRAILVHSDKESITLKEELDILQLYIELESIRFKDQFNYKIIVDEEIETEEVKIPTLLVQPFVENAIWHGLMHKEGERNLIVQFTEEGDFIKCRVEDNGVGRKQSAESKLAVAQPSKHTSKGIAVSQERLRAMRTANGHPGTIEIKDLVDSNGNPAGTSVEINFPIQNQ